MSAMTWRPWWARLLGRLITPWLQITIEDDGTTSSEMSSKKQVCYVIEDHGVTTALILDAACRNASMPAPFRPLLHYALRRRRAYFPLARRRSRVRLDGRSTIRAKAAFGERSSSPLLQTLQAHRDHLELDIQLVPVSIFVGRTPHKARGWISALLLENWTVVGNLRRILGIALNGRDTLVRFAPSISLRDVVNEGLSHQQSAHKLSRVLRTHFRQVRSAVIGPDISTRRMLIDQVLDAPRVKEAISDQARRDRTSQDAANKKAHGYAYEIAADYSHPFVRSASFLLTPVWNRIYRGVQTNHLESFKAAALGYEVVYVPSHRSTMDDLLLPYLLYTHGVALPHIVAGINLNIPIVGSLMRKGGAFFIRRSIRGNTLYSTVLSEYMARLISGGYSLAYFIEGGRSRTGRLLQPKGGMLAMTVRAFLRRPTRPVMFQPIYIGYEKLVEGKSYLDELSGIPKQKESIWRFLGGLPQVLRSDYGRVAVNFGRPIYLNDVLANEAPEWNGSPLSDNEKPTWFARTVDTLAERIQVAINEAADVNPANLLALALLSTPKNAMSEADLDAQIELSVSILKQSAYGKRVTVTPLHPHEIIAHGEKIGILTRVRHPFGDVIGVNGDTATLLSYFRNNVMHLFAAPSWIACRFQNERTLNVSALQSLGRAVYPFLKAELFLPWTSDEFAERVAESARILVTQGLLKTLDGKPDGVLVRHQEHTNQAFRLRILGYPLQQAFERYHIAIAVLCVHGSGRLSAAELENLCHLVAQRLTLLYSQASPEFFDKSLFRTFIQQLRTLQLIWTDVNAKLAFGESLHAWSRDAGIVLRRELRQAIEKLSQNLTQVHLPISA